MSKIILTKAGATGSPLTLDNGSSFPLSNPLEINQIVDVSGGGQPKVFDLENEAQFRAVNIKLVSKTNRDALLTFLAHANVRYRANTITLTDEYGATHTVRLWSKKIDFPEVQGDGTARCNIKMMFRDE